jgi:hypothetical protein
LNAVPLEAKRTNWRETGLLNALMQFLHIQGERDMLGAVALGVTVGWY